MADQPRKAESAISFDNVVCAVDASPESREAARQAAALAPGDARLWAVSVWDPGLATHAGIHAAEVASDLRAESATALRDARTALPKLEPILVKGGQVAGLLATIANLEAELISVGAHGISRPAGIVFGSIAARYEAEVVTLHVSDESRAEVGGRRGGAGADRGRQSWVDGSPSARKRQRTRVTSRSLLGADRQAPLAPLDRRRAIRMSE